MQISFPHFSKEFFKKKLKKVGVMSVLLNCILGFKKATNAETRLTTSAKFRFSRKKHTFV